MLPTLPTLLLSTNPLTLAHPTTNRLQPRQTTYAQPNLILTPFTSPGRKADPALAPETSDSPIDVRYGLDNAAPMRSHALNRAPLANELLDSSTSVFGEADEGFDVANPGGPGSECRVRLGRANATERQAGCHTLGAHPSAECFRQWSTGVDPEFASVVDPEFASVVASQS